MPRAKSVIEAELVPSLEDLSLLQLQSKIGMLFNLAIYGPTAEHQTSATKEVGCYITELAARRPMTKDQAAMLSYYDEYGKSHHILSSSV